MIGIGRRTGVAALLLGVLASICGCLGDGQNSLPNYAMPGNAGSPGFARSQTMAPASAMAPAHGAGGSMAPSGGMTAGAPGDANAGNIQRTAYFQETSPDFPGRPLPVQTLQGQTMNGQTMNGQTAPTANGQPQTMTVHPGLPGVPGNPIPGPGPCPTELAPVSHPPYTIAPPDIISIDAIRLIPKPPYRIEPLEILLINVSETLPGQDIKGPFVVSPEGTVNLGFNYGTVRVGGMTLEQVQNAIRNHLSNILRNAQVTVSLAQFRGLQQIRGEHLVRSDGTITLGTYGSVYVAGMTLGQAKCVIEKHLGEYLLNPQIAIDVFAYNSKVYYVIFDGGGFGQQVYRLPVTGNETVLDAIGFVQGLAPVSSKKRIWLARPSPAHNGCNQILPVDWNAIAMAGSTATNYQIFPGDRVYVSADCLITIDNYLSKILAPMERLMGFTFLGANTIQSIRTLGVPVGTATGTAVLVP